MRIALFTDSYPPRIDGIARFSQLERLELERQGHEVMIICPRRPGTSYAKDRHMLALPSMKALVYEGLYFGIFSPKTKRQLQQWQPQAIRINTQLTVGLAGLRFGRKHKLPVVTTCWADFDLVDEYPVFLVPALGFPAFLWLYTGYKASFTDFLKSWKGRTINRRQFLSRWLLTQFSNACSATIVPTEKIAQQIKTYVKTPLQVISFGAEELPDVQPQHGQAFRKQHSISQNTFVVTSTTRLVKEKRVDLLVEGFAKVCRQKPALEVKLVIAGDGPHRDYLRNLVDKLDITAQVIFTGSLSTVAIRQLLMASNVFANACMRETFSLCACEAALTQVPLIMSDATLGGVFVPGKTGLLFQDAAQLAQVLLQLADNPSLGRQLGTAARKQAMQFTPNQAVRQTVQLIERLK